MLAVVLILAELIDWRVCAITFSSNGVKTVFAKVSRFLKAREFKSSKVMLGKSYGLFYSC